VRVGDLPANRNVAGRKSPKDLRERAAQVPIWTVLQRWPIPLPETVVAAVAPQYATYFWFLAFGGLLMRRRMDTATAGQT
jgi:hypothetical protein